jgi:hypothetical protein
MSKLTKGFMAFPWNYRPRLSWPALTFGSVLLSVVLAVPESARAGGIFYVEGANSTLAKLDPISGAVTVIGTTKLGNTPVLLDGLAFGPDGTLFAVDNNNIQPPNFYRVDAATGALTFIGATSMDFSNGGSMGNASDRTIYAVGTGNLYTINPLTGASTKIGPLGFTTGADINGDAAGNLFIIRNSTHDLYSVSRVNGAGTLIGPTGLNQIFGMAFTGDPMYAMDTNQGVFGVYAMNLSTGQGTLVSHYDHSGIDYINTASPGFAAPEPASLTVLAIGMAGMAGYSFLKGLRNYNAISAPDTFLTARLRI